MNPYKEIRIKNQLYQWEMAEKLECPEHAYKLYELGYIKMPISLQIKVLSFDYDNYKNVIEYLKNLEKMKKKKKK